jgi:D-alanyl-lipoteichoic acid acyltransferase DltB (MBOAT superfamily)
MEISWIKDKLLAYLAFDPGRPMLFNSEDFLFTFLIFLGGYLLVASRQQVRIIWLTAYSLFFYYKSSGKFLLLLLASMLLNYLIVKHIHKSEDPLLRRRWLLTSVLLNLGLLAWFKYANFFIGSVADLAGIEALRLDIWLPVGISFYTFQIMSYAIDVYRRQLEPARSLLDFTFFVSFFPQLVAGPIVRASEFMLQIRRDIAVSREELGRGILLICGGLFKKAVISDYISINFVDRIFEAPALFTGFENLMALYGYAMQIYCDFSGYSDMAIGLGLILGFQLPINFRTPYQSASIQEFWRRWHISLSTWLRDYLYIPLGGNRYGYVRTYTNLIITMVLGGLWHGAAWRFVIWGTLHGGALAAERLLRDTRAWLRQQFQNYLDRLDYQAIHRPRGRAGRTRQRLERIEWLTQGWLALFLSIGLRLAGVFLTFHFVCFCWIFFRVESFDLAFDMIYQILFNFHAEIAGQVIGDFQPVFGLMLLGYVLHFLPEELDGWTERRFIRLPLVVKSLLIALIVWMALLAGSAGEQAFIYYQF